MYQERYDMREAFIPLWTCMECLSVCGLCVVWCVGKTWSFGISDKEIFVLRTCMSSV